MYRFRITSYHRGVDCAFNLRRFLVISWGAHRQEFIQAIKRVNFWHHVQERYDPLCHTLGICDVYIWGYITILVRSLVFSIGNSSE